MHRQTDILNFWKCEVTYIHMPIFIIPHYQDEPNIKCLKLWETQSNTQSNHLNYTISVLKYGNPGSPRISPLYSP